MISNNNCRAFVLAMTICLAILILEYANTRIYITNFISIQHYILFLFSLRLFAIAIHSNYAIIIILTHWIINWNGWGARTLTHNNHILVFKMSYQTVAIKLLNRDVHCVSLAVTRYILDILFTSIINWICARAHFRSSRISFHNVGKTSIDDADIDAVICECLYLCLCLCRYGMEIGHFVKSAMTWIYAWHDILL